MTQTSSPLDQHTRFLLGQVHTTEQELRATITALSPEFLTRIGLADLDVVERHIRSTVVDTARALGIDPPADLEDVQVLPVSLRPFADTDTWAYDEATETVGVECECCEDVHDLSEPRAVDGFPCPSCGSAATRRVILTSTAAGVLVNAR